MGEAEGDGAYGGGLCGVGGLEKTEGVESAIALSGGLWLGAHVMNGLEVWFNFHRECVPVGHAHSTHHDILTRHSFAVGNRCVLPLRTPCVSVDWLRVGALSLGR